MNVYLGLAWASNVKLPDGPAFLVISVKPSVFRFLTELTVSVSVFANRNLTIKPEKLKNWLLFGFFRFGFQFRFGYVQRYYLSLVASANTTSLTWVSACACPVCNAHLIPHPPSIGRHPASSEATSCVIFSLVFLTFLRVLLSIFCKYFQK